MTIDVDAGIQWSVGHAYHGSEFFRTLLDEHGVDPAEIRGCADLVKLPVTNKEQLRAEYPLGWTAVPVEQVARIHASSGTTGRRTVCAYTHQDLEDWFDQLARCYEYAGVDEHDRVQIMVGYGLWTAGWGFQAGAERRGAMAVPIGPGNTDLQIEMMRDLQTTVLCSTSSFALLLGELLASRDPIEHALRVGLFGSERWGESMRRRIEELLGIETFDIYGLTELYGPGPGIECARHDGIHWWSDYYVIEILDPITMQPLADDVEGEIVITSLRKEATPLLRYRTRDLSRMLPDSCPCGSTYPRIARLTGRTDDMVKIRGVAVFPSQVDSALATIDELGSEYQVHVARGEDGRDVVLLRVEAADRRGLAAAVRDRLYASLGLRIDVELVPMGSLPRSERKTARVFDLRH